MSRGARAFSHLPGHSFQFLLPHSHSTKRSRNDSCTRPIASNAAHPTRSHAAVFISRRSWTMRSLKQLFFLGLSSTIFLAGCGGYSNPGTMPGAQSATIGLSITDSPPAGVTVFSSAAPSQARPSTAPASTLPACRPSSPRMASAPSSCTPLPTPSSTM
jgi:hypothetical protein